MEENKKQCCSDAFRLSDFRHIYIYIYTILSTVFDICCISTSYHVVQVHAKTEFDDKV